MKEGALSHCADICVHVEPAVAHADGGSQTDGIALIARVSHFNVAKLGINSGVDVAYAYCAGLWDFCAFKIPCVLPFA